ncbi:hypothetical protein FA743_03945 [Paracoccus gahaiensis]|uniref:Uncharacterized protein n=1 Tax=Paracoccus gahaiensis TaxID=1706839 RepID=A0A4V5MVS9_9RHOB|nr:hypothetical protein [Paracoccus gahaiensis]TJZ93378.1 hypothetical protein FA743_03945 [Paracoccus gahaiensis]
MDHSLKSHIAFAALTALVGLLVHGPAGAVLGLLVGPLVLAVVTGVASFAQSVKTSVDRSSTGPMGRHRSYQSVQGVAARDGQRGSNRP